MNLCDICGCRESALYEVKTPTGDSMFLCLSCLDKPRIFT